jgi:hypothetical protein
MLIRETHELNKGAHESPMLMAFANEKGHLLERQLPRRMAAEYVEERDENEIEGEKMKARSTAFTLGGEALDRIIASHLTGGVVDRTRRLCVYQRVARTPAAEARTTRRTSSAACRAKGGVTDAVTTATITIEKRRS